MSRSTRIGRVAGAFAARVSGVSRLLLMTAGIVLFSAHTAAAGFFVNFCPGGSGCPSGVTEASLLFDEVLGTSDPNDYNVTITITGNLTAPAYVDEVEFFIDGIKWTDYDSMSLTGAPASGAPWTAYFDNVSGAVSSCVANTGQQNGVCAQSGAGNVDNFGAALPGQTLQWTFAVNFDSTVSPLTTSTPVTLRAQFLNSDGSNAGILSPGSRTTTTTTVPEPGTLALLGLGVLGLVSTRKQL